MERKELFLENSRQALSGIYDLLAGMHSVVLSALPAGETVLIAMDLINGFVKQGALSSPRVEAVNRPAACLAAACQAAGLPCLAFADAHGENSPEFLSYPPHCLKGTEESRLTEELEAAADWELICKNSTNGFLEPEFTHWLTQHQERTCFIIVGDCTDLCVRQFALALKADFNRRNRQCRILVPANLVATYDLGVHQGDLMQALALYDLMINGIEVVADIVLAE
jgi:nicotinamidase-related amidase